MKKEKTKKQRLWAAVSVFLALLLWQAVALIVDETLLLASPLAVLLRLLNIWREPHFLGALFFSFSRIVLGFLAALAAGTVLSALAARFKVLETLLYPYMLAVKTVPVAALIVIAFVWFSSATLSSFICFLIVLPTVYTSLLAALGSVDGKMTEMASIFRLPYLSRLTAIYLPHIKPHFLSVCALAAGLAFKSGIAAEIIAVPASASVGEMIYYAKLYLQTADLYVWTLLIVLMSVAFEKGFTALLSFVFSAVSRLASPRVPGVIPLPQKTANAPQVELCGICKRYGENIVLNDFSATVKAGAVTAFMGSSGIGKTTLLRLVGGLEKADGGFLSASERVSFVFQEDRLCDDLSATGNALLGSSSAKPAEAAGLLLLLGLDGHIDKPVRELSGGMRRRVAIARALISDAPLLLLDEPFKGLDGDTKDGVIRVVKKYTEGKTVLLVTHDEEEAKLLSAEIVTL